jgi:hypothetical protein
MIKYSEQKDIIKCANPKCYNSFTINCEHVKADLHFCCKRCSNDYFNIKPILEENNEISTIKACTY